MDVLVIGAAMAVMVMVVDVADAVVAIAIVVHVPTEPPSGCQQGDLCRVRPPDAHPRTA